MLGYWDEPEKTAEVLDAAGWMHTGDLATIDAEGYCNIVGRIKDMVIRGGENLYPREIEEFLYRHPKIQDVQVFGVPTTATARSCAPGSGCAPGETLTADEVRAFCQGQIAHYKIPRYVEFVERIPDDGHRQDPEIPDARRGRGEARVEGGEDGVSLATSAVRSDDRPTAGRAMAGLRPGHPTPSRGADCGARRTGCAHRRTSIASA